MLHITVSNYQGKKNFEGNQLNKILNNLDKLKDIIPQDLIEFYDAFASVKAFKDSVCTSQLKPNYLDVIKNLEESFLTLHHRFGCTIPNKVHIAVTHY